MKVYLKLEDADGQRIAEIQTDQVFREMFGELTLRTALSALGNCLEAQVASPARGLIRAYIAKLVEGVPHQRRDRGGEVVLWPGDSAVLAEMDRRAHAMMEAAREGD